MTRAWWRSPAALTLLGCLIVVAVFAYKAWQRRWLCDDGLIVFRVVDQIHAGNGPVFNALERTEAATSTLWTWLLAGTYSVYPGSLDHLAINLGWICSVLALVVGFDASRRFWRLRGMTAPLIPAGALITVAVYGFWDFATSGLETGMTWLWCSACWWLLVTIGTSTRRQWIAAIVIGAGPLVRPDYALVTVVFLVAAWFVVRPARRRTLALLGAAIALPLLYEVFRAGFYGILVPLPALAKSATGSQWGRGLHYLHDFVRPCLVWIPTSVLAITLGVALRHRVFAKTELVTLAAPIASGLLLALYLVRVGGDFMHARMLLGPALLVVLPAFVLPLQRGLVIAPIVGLVAWAAIVGPLRDDNRTHSDGGELATVWDERVATLWYTRFTNPRNRGVFIQGMQPVSGWLADATRERREMLLTEGGVQYAMRAGSGATQMFIVGRLGGGGAIVPLDGMVIDVMGLANPIGARIPITKPGKAGHEKELPIWWILADVGDLAQIAAQQQIPPDQLAEADAARRAFECGDLAELRASVRAPLTFSRFWSNVFGSIGRTRLVIPTSAIAAEREFCR